MNQTYYIFRHGKAVANGEEYGDAILTASLLPESIPVMKRMAEFLKNVPSGRNFSSEIERCRQTTQIISSITEKKFIFDSRLNEFYQENFLDFSRRVEDFLQEQCFSSDGPFLICTHAAVIAALKHFVINRKFDIRYQLDYIQPGELLIINEGKIIEKKSFL